MTRDMTAPRPAAGTLLPPLTKRLKQENITAFSRHFHDFETGESVHCFPESARRKGFPRTIAQGLMSHAYISELLVSYFGEDALFGSRINVKFVRPTFEGDTVAVHAEIERVEEDGYGSVVGLHVWCLNQDGQPLTVGEAEVRLSLANRGPEPE